MASLLFWQRDTREYFDDSGVILPAHAPGAGSDKLLQGCGSKRGRHFLLTAGLTDDAKIFYENIDCA